MLLIKTETDVLSSPWFQSPTVFQPMKNGRYLFLAKKATRETCHNPSGLQVYEIDQLGRIHRIYNIEAGFSP